MSEIRREMAARAVHPGDVVVLLPYAQLMQEARQAWLDALAGAGASATFLPRFETTQNWARNLGPAPAGPGDLRREPARDLLTAGSLLSPRLGAKRRDLVQPVMQAAWTLAAVAAAMPPQERQAWGERMASVVGVPDEESPLYLDTYVGRVALAWACASAYPTDVLYQANPALLVVVCGFQPDPLALALLARWPGRSVAIALDQPAVEGEIRMHPATDAEDEAERAAACVLAHLAADRRPVALVAQDRFLVRRVRAMLANRKVSIRDETGWTLATTRSAAALMALCRALAHPATGDDVLDALKHAPAFEAAPVARLEAQMRQRGLRTWVDLPHEDPIVRRLAAWRERLGAARPVTDWLVDLGDVLRQAGLWAALDSDAAGRVLLDATCLREPAARSLTSLGRPMSQAAFLRWLVQVLEAASFVPPHPPGAEVLILPLAQLLGRSPAAVVCPGADEHALAPAPDPSGPWTAVQRAALGLASRSELADQTAAAWRSMLRAPRVDVLWRTSERGEPILASALVRSRQLVEDLRVRAPRVARSLAPRPQSMPGPSAASLASVRLSASAYADLRQCPYKYFALRLLRLEEVDEIDEDLDKRDYGQWIHAVLAGLHRALAAQPGADRSGRRRLADLAAEQATRELGLTQAEFLPFRAAWPRLRDRYLDWLDTHEAAGHRFVGAEQAHEHAFDGLSIHGRIDRLDQDPGGGIVLIDYKTESRQRAADRVASGSEDVQLPFYAALLPRPPKAAYYLSLADRDVRSHAHQDIERARERLIEGLRADLYRVAQGAPLRALGVGPACSHCRARGLCRKDDWGAGLAVENPDG